MNHAKRTIPRIALASMALVGMASASETHRYTAVHCVPESGFYVHRHNNGMLEAVSFEPEYIYCPVLTLETTSAFSDMDLYTSSGVAQSEAVLVETSDNGSFIASYAPSSQLEGELRHHDWPAITLFSTTSAVSIRVYAANDDEIYGMAATDSDLSY